MPTWPCRFLFLYSKPGLCGHEGGRRAFLAELGTGGFTTTITFQFAIPMLTGWDLEYLCEDHNVKEIGIWIDHWSYQSPGPVASGGTLQYTVKSILRDSGNSGFFSKHKITILGLKSVSGGKAGAGPAPAKAGSKALKKIS
jgi:hypothetical protein